MVNILRSHTQDGFTLIELLVAIGIIGTLAAIAIPQYAAYRNRGLDAQVKYDLKNAALAQERFFTINQNYQPCGPCTSVQLPDFRSTLGVTVQAVAPPGAGTFTLTAMHNQCGAGTWTYSSLTGTIVPPGPPCG